MRQNTTPDVERLQRRVTELESRIAELTKKEEAREVISLQQTAQEPQSDEDRSLAEEKAWRNQALLNATGRMAKVGGWELNLQTQSLIWTDEVYRIHEVARDFQPTVATAINFYAPEYKPVISEAVERAIEHGEAFNLELQIVTAKGVRRWVHAIGEAYAQDGRTVIVGGTFHDISERKQAEAEREKLEAQLRQAAKMESVGRLAGGVAHDFNNILGVILGHTELALEQVDSSLPIHENLMEIRMAAQRSAELTRQLLAFGRKQAMAPRVLDLNETVAGMLKMLRRLIGEDIDLAWNAGANLWRVKADPPQIDQILTNLCVNARDAINGVGKVTIGLECKVLDKAYCAENVGASPGEYVMLAVSDNGCGMDRETMSHLFEPFFTTKKMGRGTGLGLATVYGIVKQNNGYIEVKSELGQGASFKIYLPRHIGEVEKALLPCTPSPVLYRRETILLVEDELALLKVTATKLEKQGFTVIAASSPEEAIRIVKEQGDNIDLLITDVIMPNMNGWDLSQYLLSLNPRLKYIFMSGYSANHITPSGVLDKGLHFIRKPFSTQDLSSIVLKALEKSQA